MNNPKRVCFFGIYKPTYSRNRVLMRGFKENGWEVLECRVDPHKYRGLFQAVRLLAQALQMRKNKPDLVLVAFPGQRIVWLARLVFGKKIIFDAFLSLFDSNVFDRKLYSPRSLRGIRDYFLDWSSVRLAQKVLLDTNEHIHYFNKTFKISENKFIRVLVGSDDNIFVPSFKNISPHSSFTVEFHGTYIPLQGVEYIIEAAVLLKDEDIHFNLIGTGQTFMTVQRRASEMHLSKVTFLDKMPIEKVAEYIALADICIGIVGVTEKCMRVIPNKVYECAAIGKAIITADSPAMREVFADGKDVVFCTAADAASLAHQIKILKNNTALRDRLGRAAAEKFKQMCIPRIIVRQLLSDLSL